MDSHGRLAVIGLGAAGMAAALAGAEQGFEVIGFEQADLDNQAASSGGRGKIIRFGYDDPFYAALMRDTMTRWTALAQRTGRRIMDRHGGLHVGPPAMIDIVAEGIADAGQPFERPVADADTFGARLHDGEDAVLEPAAGVMWTTQVRMGLADAARGAGATLREHTEVRDLHATASGFRIRTREEDFDVDRVIVAGGPWAFRLVPGAADAFAITRRFQVVFETDEPLGDGLPRPWIDHGENSHYGMINVAPRQHLIGLHDLEREQPVADPGEPDDEKIRRASIREQLDYLARRFPDRPAHVVDVRACHYTSTASRDFVVDDSPGLPGVILLSACSGHGFKFSITMGAYAATLAGGGSVPDRERFHLQLATMT